MSTSASISKGDGSTENTPLGIWALLKFAALLSVTACFLLRVVKKAAGSAIGLIIGPPGPTPPGPTPGPAPPQDNQGTEKEIDVGGGSPATHDEPKPWRRSAVVQHQKTVAVQKVNADAEARAQRIQNGGRFRN